MIVPDLKERIDSISPGGGSFGIEGSASATMSYVVDGPLGPTGKVDAFLQTVFPFAGVNTVFAGQLAFAFSPAFDQLPLIGIGDNAID